MCERERVRESIESGCGSRPDYNDGYVVDQADPSQLSNWLLVF
jgi:hypothetical protein